MQFYVWVLITLVKCHNTEENKRVFFSDNALELGLTQKLWGALQHMVIPSSLICNELSDRIYHTKENLAPECTLF